MRFTQMFCKKVLHDQSYCCTRKHLIYSVYTLLVLLWLKFILFLVLAEAVIKFSNENWKEVAQEVQGPVFTTNLKKIVKNANKYLKTISTDEYIAA